jgi:hypothetical protein
MGAALSSKQDESDNLSLKRVRLPSTTSPDNIKLYQDSWYGGVDSQDHPREGPTSWLYITLGYNAEGPFVRTRNHKAFKLIPRQSASPRKLWQQLADVEETEFEIKAIGAGLLRLGIPGPKHFLFQFNRYHAIEDPVPHIQPTSKRKRLFPVPVARREPCDWLKAMRIIGTIDSSGEAMMTLNIESDERSLVTTPNGNVFRVNHNPIDQETIRLWKEFKYNELTPFPFEIIYYTSVCIRVATSDHHTVDLFMCHRARPVRKRIRCNAADRSTDSTFNFGEDKHDLPYFQTADESYYRMDHPLTDPEQNAWIALFVKESFFPSVFRWANNAVTIGHPDQGTASHLTFHRIPSLDAPVHPGSKTVDVDYKPLAKRPDPLAEITYGSIRRAGKKYTIAITREDDAGTPLIQTGNRNRWRAKPQHFLPDTSIGASMWTLFMYAPGQFEVAELQLDTASPVLRLREKRSPHTFIDFALAGTLTLLARIDGVLGMIYPHPQTPSRSARDLATNPI